MQRAWTEQIGLPRCPRASAASPTCSMAAHSNSASTCIHSARGCSLACALPALPATQPLSARARGRIPRHRRPLATATPPRASRTSTTTSPDPTNQGLHPDPSSPNTLLPPAPSDPWSPESVARDLGRVCAHGDVPRVTQLLDQLLTASHGDPVRRRQLLTSRVAGGGTPLHAAAAKGHVEVVRLLLGAGADPNAAAEGSGCAVERPAKRQEPGVPPPLEIPGWRLVESVEPDDWYQEETPLHAACAGGHVEVVQQLLAAGADPDALSPKRGPPLAVAAANGHAPVVRTLLDAGANGDAVRPSDGATPLVVAINESMDRTIPYMLIDAGVDLEIADGEGYTPLLHAAVNRETYLVDALRSAGATRLRDSVAAESSREWLFQHCLWGWKVGPVETLMFAGGDPNGELRGLTPLLLASYRGDARLVRALLELGADVNRRVGQQGCTALDCACGQGHQEVAEVLLRFGAGVGVKREEGMELLEHACKKGHLGLVRLLLAVVADPWVVYEDGVRLLAKACYWGRGDVVLELLVAAGPHAGAGREAAEALVVAALLGREECVKVLLEAGVHPDVRYEGRLTPLLAAATKGHVGVVRQLLAAGACASGVGGGGRGTGEGGSPYEVAMNEGHVEVAEVLLAADAANN